MEEGRDSVKKKKKVEDFMIIPKEKLFDPKYKELFRSDASINPSYTHLKIPYYLVCERRSASKLKDYEELLSKDLELLQKQHPYAFGGVQIERAFMTGVKLPTRSPYPLTQEQKKKLHKIVDQRETE